jgi:DNA-binding NarL/FixJ family response regulator
MGLRFILLGLSIFFEILLPLTITLYFLSNLVPLFYLWRISDSSLEPIQGENTANSEIEKLTLKFKVTKREKEIIAQISLGKTNQQIADELFISLQTVKDHTHRIYKKIGVNSRIKLIRLLSKEKY